MFRLMLVTLPVELVVGVLGILRQTPLDPRPVRLGRNGVSRAFEVAPELVWVVGDDPVYAEVEQVREQVLPAAVSAARLITTVMRSG